MTRWTWLAGIVMVGFGCGSSAPEGPEPTGFSAASDVVLAERSAATACPGGGHAAPAGMVARFVVRATMKAVSCHCAETTTYAWSCSSERHCMSDYDYGGHNPTVCEPAGEEPTDVIAGSPELIARDYPVVVGCVAAVTPIPDAPDAYELSVSCPSPARVDVLVSLDTAAGRTSASASLVFTASGACPAMPPVTEGPDGGL